MKFVLGIDQGTTGSTAMLFDVKAKRIIATENEEFRQIYPESGWVEHNLNDIWSSVRNVIKKVISSTNTNPSDIGSIGITNQRETTCLFNKQGEPLHNAIVWQDRRTSRYCEEKKESYQKLSRKTGLPLDPYFSGTKLNWILNNCNVDIKKSLFGTIDTFLLFKLTGNISHCTEPTNASRTLLMDLESCEWDNELLNFFDIPREILPKIKNTFDNFGSTRGLDFLPDGIPITCLFGDQQSALFGQACTEPGGLKCTYGTGAFMLLNTGNEIVQSQNGLLTTVAYQEKGKASYSLEGSTYIAGAAVQFLRDNFEFIESSPEIEKLAESAELGMMKDLYFFPFFTGIGSPYWKADAKACIYGMTRNTNKAQIARACLEGICFSIQDLILALEKDLNSKIDEIRVDGGAVKNSLLMQIQSNISGKAISKPQIIETTAFGSILGSLVGLGMYSIDDIKNFWKLDNEFKPESDQDKIINYYLEKKNKWIEYCQSFF